MEYDDTEPISITGQELIVAPCYNCENPVTFMLANKDRIMGIPVLPSTNLPPDVKRTPGGFAIREFTQEEMAEARANRKPLCLTCAERQATAIRSRGMVAPPIDPSAYDIPA
jgi:hypothetical protein